MLAGGWRAFAPLALAAFLGEHSEEFAAPAVTSDSSADADLFLVERSQRGELLAFDELVGRHLGLVTALLYRFWPWRADLEDLVQETFVRAYRNLAQWRPERPFSHWSKRVAVNVGLEYCRRNKRPPLALRIEPVENADPLAGLAAPTGDDLSRDAFAETQWLLSHLPADDRALLTLLHLDEMPLAEVAEHFGWSRVNAKVRAFRARARLRTILKRHGYTFA